VVVTTNSLSATPGGGFQLTVTATCTTGVVIAGGAAIGGSPTQAQQVALNQSFPQGNTWVARARQGGAGTTAWNLTSYAVCRVP
jgi:hypothetical protein